ncbi:hypothetical protein BVG19_g3562 [[Candida] boidinii]|nr:hypothetical protein BVG19_g3562 [[Candida] boidinii]OWB48957.1 hypothetical protein B5S27_g495 [[Candida] boidinii]OWB84912.1 hypothetical protein B5S33_g3569 [[Candida] boidinii]
MESCYLSYMNSVEEYQKLNLKDAYRDFTIKKLVRYISVLKSINQAELIHSKQINDLKLKLKNNSSNNNNNLSSSLSPLKDSNKNKAINKTDQGNHTPSSSLNKSERKLQLDLNTMTRRYNQILIQLNMSQQEKNVLKKEITGLKQKLSSNNSTRIHHHQINENNQNSQNNQNNQNKIINEEIPNGSSTTNNSSINKKSNFSTTPFLAKVTSFKKTNITANRKLKDDHFSENNINSPRPLPNTEGSRIPQLSPARLKNNLSIAPLGSSLPENSVSKEEPNNNINNTDTQNNNVKNNDALFTSTPGQFDTSQKEITDKENLPKRQLSNKLKKTLFENNEIESSSNDNVKDSLIISDTPPLKNKLSIVKSVAANASSAGDKRSSLFDEEIQDDDFSFSKYRGFIDSKLPSRDGQIKKRKLLSNKGLEEMITPSDDEESSKENSIVSPILQRIKQNQNNSSDKSPLNNNSQNSNNKKGKSIIISPLRNSKSISFQSKIFENS